VKIYIKLTTAFFWISFLCFASVSTLSAQLHLDNLSETKNNLGAGINLSIFEHYWTSAEILMKEDISTKLKTIARSGFKTVRLPVAFDLFLQPNSYNLQPELLSKLKHIYTTCAQLKLNLIITYHYGKLNDNNVFSEQERISWVWKQVQRNFAGLGYNNLLFELYNEPTLSGEQWKLTITTIIEYLRYEDKNRIYIIGGTNYNSLDELKSLGKLPDTKLLYTFHFYEPFLFTHQGADWTNNKTNIKGLPYPYKKNKMPSLAYADKYGNLNQDFKTYPQEVTNAAIIERLKTVAAFCIRNNMPLICTETGVIDLADKKSRKHYLQDITHDLYQLNIQTVLWDYDQKFSIKRNETKVLKYLKPWIKQSKK
jgi:endoglucanase